MVYDPNAPEHQRDHPHEGFIRVWLNHEDFYDMADDEVESVYVDNNVAGFHIDVKVTSNIDEGNIRLWYSAGHEYTTQLGWIENDNNPCSKFLMEGNGLVVPASRDLHPMLNSLTTPRLYWIRSELHAHNDRLSGTDEQLEQLFGEITYQYAGTGVTSAAAIKAAEIPIDSPF